MDMHYIFSATIAIVVLVYFKSQTAFVFARMGADYLRSLLEAPEKFNNDRPILNSIEHRELKSIADFVATEQKIRSTLFVAFFTNCIGLLYPQEALLETGLGWLLIILLGIINMDVILIYFGLHRNTIIINQICNGYAKLVLTFDAQNEELFDITRAIEGAFKELEEEIAAKAKKEPNTKGVDGNASDE